jgi:hypothetical protein
MRRTSVIVTGRQPHAARLAKGGAMSAGSHPTGEVHPRSLALLAREGIPKEGLLPLAQLQRDRVDLKAELDRIGTLMPQETSSFHGGSQ